MYICLRVVCLRFRPSECSSLNFQEKMVQRQPHVQLCSITLDSEGTLGGSLEILICKHFDSCRSQWFTPKAGNLLYHQPKRNRIAQNAGAFQRTAVRMQYHERCQDSLEKLKLLLLFRRTCLILIIKRKLWQCLGLADGGANALPGFERGMLCAC